MGVTLIPAERNTRNLYVAAYVRVSSKSKVQEESYEAQATYYENKIKNTPGWDFVGVYGERESGTHAENRDEFQRMIQDALARKIDLIICKSVSRWARNTVDALKTIRLLNDHFVHVIFEQEDVDTRTPGHLFKLNLSCAVAQAESESISENLKWLYRKRAERGIFKAVSGRYFGFNTDDGNFTPDENAKYVRQMFQEYVSGKTLREIAKGLEGVKNNKGKQVSASQVKSILANEVYKGDLHICKSVSRNVITGEPDAEQYGKYIEGHHEAIVGADLWAKAQKRLEAEARPRKDKSKEIDELEMDILAMAEDGWPLKEIAERLGTSVDVVRTCEKKLKAKGWLKEEMSKKQEIETRIETVYQAVKEGHQVGIGSFLGMKSGEVRYALTKLEKAGRVRKEDGAWVAV